MLTLSKSSEAKNFFDKLIEMVQGIKIKEIFSRCPSYGRYEGFRRYGDNSLIYIVFENEQCLVLDYVCIDGLCAEYRQLTDEEKYLQADQLIKDLFNCSVDIYDRPKSSNGTKLRTETISLEYGVLLKVEIHHVTHEYAKWVKGNLEYVAPTDETFDRIKFVMGNDNTFSICADDAETNGWVRLWSEEAKETVIFEKSEDLL